MEDDPLDELRQINQKFTTSVNDGGTVKRAQLEEEFEGLDDGGLDDGGLLDIARSRRNRFDEYEDNDDPFGGFF